MIKWEYKVLSLRPCMKKEDILKPIAKEKEHARKTTFQISEKSNLPSINVTKQVLLNG